MALILVVDDEAQLCLSFEKLLKSEGHEVVTASTGEAGIRAVRGHVPDLVIMDVRMPGMDGLEAFRVMHDIAPRMPVIIMTAFAATDIAIEAAKLGAFDYVLKPFDIPEILKLIEQALEAGHFMRDRVEIGDRPEVTHEDALLGRSPVMQEVFKAIGRAAPTDATVLIRGESGTGKELVARAIYQHSLRTEAPFLVLNCVAIPETLLESELFGYEKGAFTGAAARRVGKIEQADQGTVFLDEIGDMPVNIQAKLLRLLQERRVERLGGRGPIEVDVRIIAATNRNLEDAIARGRFREDLFYRLNVVTITLPPLRERGGDIELLTRHFLARYSRRIGIENPGITDEARKLLQATSWPGNVRELANVIHKALIFSRGYPLGPGDVSQAVEESACAFESDPAFHGRKAVRQWIRAELERGGSRPYDRLHNTMDAMIVREALAMTGGNRTRAAGLLGISRPTLIARIERFGLKVETIVSEKVSLK